MVYGLAMSYGYLARVIEREECFGSLVLEGWGKDWRRSGSNSISSRRLDRETMRMVGGCGIYGLWCLVSSIAMLRVLLWDGLVKERLDRLLSIVYVSITRADWLGSMLTME